MFLYYLELSDDSPLVVFNGISAQVCPNKGSPKLFVFGDSYVDTGNWPKNVSGTWKEPFGLTFPGKPDGRASDGRVLTDHIGESNNSDDPRPGS
ncbi:hypothetical protein OIU76_012628 [Salix suchowensis]|nr:hypothetical protein OIU76_012628 [Salix suchowensis]